MTSLVSTDIGCPHLPTRHWPIFYLTPMRDTDQRKRVSESPNKPANKPQRTWETANHLLGDVHESRRPRIEHVLVVLQTHLISEPVAPLLRRVTQVGALGEQENLMIPVDASSLSTSPKYLRVVPHRREILHHIR